MIFEKSYNCFPKMEGPHDGVQAFVRIDNIFLNVHQISFYVVPMKSLFKSKVVF
jgi:hypothetical protein